jgi:formate dehydrogenase subunit delta
MSDHELQRITQMANQIAANFSFHDDQAVRLADHLNRFWAPSMRHTLLAHVASGGAGLEPAVIEAAGLLRK